MNILAHRGHWRTKKEQNSLAALKRALDAGFGIETDVRDFGGKLIIAHDPPHQETGYTLLEELLSLPNPTDSPLAINIKADGLANLVANCFSQSSQRNWFVFDMSIPDTRSQLRSGNPVFARMSEVEENPPWLDQCAGIWLDGFDSEWYEPELIDRLLVAGKKLCIVSAELHARNPAKQWSLLMEFRDNERLLICTDLPEEANRRFNAA